MDKYVKTKNKITKELHKDYKMLRNHVNELIRLSKKTTMENILQSIPTI